MRPSVLRAAALATTLLTAAIATPSWAADKAPADPVVAIVNGKDIHKSDVMAIYSTTQFRQVPLPMVYDQVLDYVITGQLVLAEARKQKVGDDPKVKAAIKQAEERVLQQAYLAKRVDAEVTDEAVRKRYEEVKKETPPKEEVRARHILVDSEDAAKQVLADLKSGISFEDEAKAKTKDPSGKENGGDLGYFTKDDMVAEFADAAFKLKKGEVSGPVKTEFGWHIIKLEDRRTAPPPTFEESKGQIHAELAQKAAQKIIEGMTESAKIKRFDLDGKPLPAEDKSHAKKK